MTGYTTSKPTIQELEALLNDHDSPPVAITPDGWVVPASMIDRMANQAADQVLKPPYPVSEPDKKLATDWYTWGFQCGIDAEKKMAECRSPAVVGTGKVT